MGATDETNVQDEIIYMEKTMGKKYKSLKSSKGTKKARIERLIIPTNKKRTYGGGREINCKENTPYKTHMYNLD